MISPELLRRYPFFGVFNDAQLKEIAMIAEEEIFESGQSVFQEGQPANFVYLLQAGGIDLFQTVAEEKPSGEQKEFLLGEINPGELFGISSVIEPYRYTTSARTTVQSRAIVIDATALRALFEKDLRLAYLCMQQIAKTALERLNATRVQLAAAWA